MTFIEKIKNLWKKIVTWVTGVSSKVDDFIIKYAPIAVSVVNWIKEFNESTTADIVETILTLTASQYGAKYVPLVRKWLEKNLPIIIDSLNLASEVAASATLAEKIVAARKAIELLPVELKSTIWASLATMIANDLADDGKLSVSEALAIIAYVYENKLNDKSLTKADVRAWLEQ